MGLTTEKSPGSLAHLLRAALAHCEEGKVTREESAKVTRDGQYSVHIPEYYQGTCSRPKTQTGGTREAGRPARGGSLENATESNHRDHCGPCHSPEPLSMMRKDGAPLQSVLLELLAQGGAQTRRIRLSGS